MLRFNNILNSAMSTVNKTVGTTTPVTTMNSMKPAAPTMPATPKMPTSLGKTIETTGQSMDDSNSLTR